MILSLAGDADDAMFSKIIESFNKLTVDEKLHIYFTCPNGGLADAAEAIIDFININQERITMTFYGELFSAGMVIFLTVKAEKKILPLTRGMYHFSWQSMDINETGKPSGEYDVFSMKEMKKSKSKSIDFMKTTKLSDKEVNQIKKGKDVYFSSERMTELI